MPLKMRFTDPQKAIAYFENRTQLSTGPSDLNHFIEQAADLSIIDVREPDDYAQGHIPGAVNLPKAQWKTLKGLRKDVVNVLYCYSLTCHLAPTAALEFAKQGFPVTELEGGFDEWKKIGLRVEGGGEARVA